MKKIEDDVKKPYKRLAICILVTCITIFLFWIFKIINNPDYNPSFFVHFMYTMAGLGIIASIVELRKK